MKNLLLISFIVLVSCSSETTDKVIESTDTIATTTQDTVVPLENDYSLSYWVCYELLDSIIMSTDTYQQISTELRSHEGWQVRHMSAMELEPRPLADLDIYEVMIKVGSKEASSISTHARFYYDFSNGKLTYELPYSQDGGEIELSAATKTRIAQVCKK